MEGYGWAKSAHSHQASQHNISCFHSALFGSNHTAIVQGEWRIMSSPAKSIVLRAVLPDDASTKVALALGPTGKAESKKVTLVSGNMTTEAIVGRIKELSKLR